MSEYYRPQEKGPESKESVDYIDQRLSEIYQKTTLTSSEQGIELPEIIVDEDDNSNEMAGCYNGDTRQRLRAVIRAGNEIFSIIDVSVLSYDQGTTDTENIIKSTIISRHIKGERAEPVGILDKNSQVFIGREHLSANNENLSDTLSRTHFAIAKDNEGRIAIADTNSTNHTEVFFQNDNPVNYEDPKNPLSRLEFWSIKSAKARFLTTNYTQQ